MFPELSGLDPWILGSLATFYVFRVGTLLGIYRSSWGHRENEDELLENVWSPGHEFERITD
eukprot:10746465-Karenia_brevis.AAC.1